MHYIMQSINTVIITIYTTPHWFLQKIKLLYINIYRGSSSFKR